MQYNCWHEYITAMCAAMCAAMWAAMASSSVSLLLKRRPCCSRAWGRMCASTWQRLWAAGHASHTPLPPPPPPPPQVEYTVHQDEAGQYVPEGTPGASAVRVPDADVDKKGDGYVLK